MKGKHAMNTVKLPGGKLTLGIVAAVCCFLFSACEYEVPITSRPTRSVDEKLLGNWMSKDGKENIKVRRLDNSIYIVSYNGDLFRAYHSDVAGTPFVSVQNIDSAERKYVYLTWKLSEDGKRLSLRVVNDKVIPIKTKGSASVQKLLKKNLQNPDLLEHETQFTKAE